MQQRLRATIFACPTRAGRVLKSSVDLEIRIKSAPRELKYGNDGLMTDMGP
jgi:hypothetical protein